MSEPLDPYVNCSQCGALIADCRCGYARTQVVEPLPVPPNVPEWLSYLSRSSIPGKTIGQQQVRIDAVFAAVYAQLWREQEAGLLAAVV